MSPTEQRALLAQHDDISPSAATELAALTAIQTFLLETDEPTAAAKLATVWARRFQEETAPSPIAESDPPVEPVLVNDADTFVTRRVVNSVAETIISTPDPDAIAQAMRAFLRVRMEHKAAN
jgi:hypothetical protein